MGRRRRDAQAASLFAVPDAEGRWRSIGHNVEVHRGEEVWRVVHVAEVLYEFSADDAASRKLCMAQLSLQKLATEPEIAEAFGCSRPTVCRAKRAFLREGASGLVAERRGPKSSRLEPGLEAKMLGLRRQGWGYRRIAGHLGLPRSTVFSACKRHGLTGRDAQRPLPFEDDADAAQDGVEEADADGADANGDGPSSAEEAADAGSPVVLAEPAAQVAPGEPAPARTLERVLAYLGRLGRPEVAPAFASGSEVPELGLLLGLALVPQDGCLAVARRVYGGLSNGFYGLRALVLTLLMKAWLGIKTLGALRHGTPHLWGRVLGLDRLPETKTVRRKLKEVAARGRAREFMGQMAARRVAANKDLCGVLYVDGHVREYHGRRRLSKAFATRRRLAVPAVEEWWVHDATSAPVLKIPGRPDRSLVRVVGAVVKDARGWLGKDRPLTVVFDRGGWSPKLFAALAAQGVWVVTYRKGRRRTYPAREFDREVAIPGRHGGPPKVYRTRDRRARIAGHTFRSITVLRKTNGQTEIITTDRHAEAAVILARMFSRWGQENYFKYNRAHRDLDTLGAYAFEPVPADVEIPNPAHKALDRRVKRAAARLRACEGAWEKAGSPSPEPRNLRWWRTRVANLKAERRGTPRRIRVGDLPEDQRPEQPNAERELFTDVLSMSAHRVETRLLGLLAPYYRCTHKNGRELLRQVFRDRGDLSVDGDRLTVTLNPLASPHQTAALAGLCRAVNGLAPTFPETSLRLHFQVHDHP